MKLKKIINLALIATLAVGSLVGCGNKEEATDDGHTIGSEAEDATELEMWAFVELHGQFYSEMVDKWNETHKDKQIKINVNVMPYDDMHNKLQIALNSGEGTPDMVDIELSKFPNFTQGQPKLMDLTEAAKPYVDDIVESRLNLYSKDDKLYGLPTHVGATVAFYNVELLEEAGIDYTKIKTWEDFKTAGIKYYEAIGKYMGTADTFATWVSNLLLAQNGSDYLDEDGNLQINSPDVVKSLELLKDMQDANAVGTVPGGQPDTEEAYGAYNNGDYVCAIMPLWQMSRYVNYMPDLEGKIAIAPVPTIDGAKAQSVGGGGTGTSVIEGKENSDLAAEFLAYAKLSEEANVEIWNTLGFDPCNMKVWEDEAITHDEENKFVKYFVNNPFDVLNDIKGGIAGLDSWTSEKFPAINNNFVTLTLNSIFEDGMDVKEALDKAQEDLKNELE